MNDAVGVNVVDLGDDEFIVSGGGVPIMLFSAMVQPSPMMIGPSNEYILARGWMTVPAPMEIWYVPCITADSATVAVGWIVSGGRGAEGDEDADCGECERRG